MSGMSTWVKEWVRGTNLGGWVVCVSVVGTGITGERSIVLVSLIEIGWERVEGVVGIWRGAGDFIFGIARKFLSSLKSSQY